MVSGVVRIDARGMLCPWPAVRLAKALRGGATAVSVVADDPAAAHEIAVVAKAAGAEMSIIPDPFAPTFVVTQAPVGNIVLTEFP